MRSCDACDTITCIYSKYVFERRSVEANEELVAGSRGLAACTALCFANERFLQGERREESKGS